RGEGLTLCCDAGTPAVSGPGGALVRAAREAGHRVEPVPGPSALTAALSASGMDAAAFCFLGFLPRTPGKARRALEAALAGGSALAFFDAQVRRARTLTLAAPRLGEREVMEARELTKLHDTVNAGSAL